MKSMLLGMARGLIALLFVAVLMSPGTPVSSMPVASGPDITFKFSGLMVFDEIRSSTQVVRLHSDAHYHNVRIRIKGPGYHHPIDWATHYPKGAALEFKIVNKNGPLANNAIWSGGSKPKRIGDLHPKSATFPDLVMIEDAFGPIFTFRSGSFSSGLDVEVEFVSDVDTKPSEKVPDLIVAKVDDLGKTGDLGLLTGTGLPDVRLTKPTGSDPKWEIEVSNEPDFAHACGYHFSHYYSGFRFSNGSAVPSYIRFVAKPTAGGTDPCDRPLTAAEIKQLIKDNRGIPTRPCIPIGG